MKANNMFWKCYSLFWLLLYVTHIHRPEGAFAWLGVAISGFAFIALLGYAFSHAFFRRTLWQFVFWALVAFNIYGHFSRNRDTFFVELIAFIVLLPAYVGVFRYAYSSPPLWRSTEVHTG